MKLHVWFSFFQNLETIPKLKDLIEEKTKEVEALKSEVKDKTSLLTVARKSAREYKDQIRVSSQHHAGIYIALKLRSSVFEKICSRSLT